MGEKLEKVRKLISRDKKISVLLLLALLAVVFLIIIEFADSEKSEDVSDSTMTTDEYTEKIEKKLTELISSVEGAGQTVVMVTLEAGEENVFAKEIKTEDDKNDGKSSNKYEYEYVVIKNGTSTENGMLLKVTEPDIRGVAVVCDGGDNAAVRENIINAVSAVLDIKTNNISVCKRKS